MRGAWIEINMRQIEAEFDTSLPVRGAWIEIFAFRRMKRLPVRRSPCGERGLKLQCRCIALPRNRRSPCGERGLKFLPRQRSRQPGKSLPVRGAWIEIARSGAYQPHEASRSPCGERGLKLAAANFQALLLGRSPCGERGLKLHYITEITLITLSLPVRGAWIEMERTQKTCEKS